MTLYILTVIIGLAVLTWGAGKFVDSAGSLSIRLGLSPLVIGMTVVALGTSAPEIMVSVSAAVKGSSDLVIGNALGSNIANIGLVLGTSALVAPLVVKSSVLKKELPIMLAATALGGYAMANNAIGMLDAFIMLAMLIFSFWWLMKSSGSDTLEEHSFPELTLAVSVLWVMLSVGLLSGSAYALVWASSNIALYFGVSELIIGLTIVAIGTSLPELATSVVSTFKGQYDIAIGNIVGSNLFNILILFSIAGLLSPGEIPKEALSRDFPALLFITLAFGFVIVWRGRSSIPRWVGGLFLVGYVAYLGLLFMVPEI